MSRWVISVIGQPATHVEVDDARNLSEEFTAAQKRTRGFLWFRKPDRYWRITDTFQVLVDTVIMVQPVVRKDAKRKAPIGFHSS